MPGQAGKRYAFEACELLEPAPFNRGCVVRHPILEPYEVHPIFLAVKYADQFTIL
jgi:hypothetical protein